jgi:starch synthase
MGRTLKIWLPTIRVGSGTDVFTQRLADALACRGVEVIITWFSRFAELMPDILRYVTPPPGVDIIHANSANAFAFKREGIPLVVTEHHYTLDPAYRPFKSFGQNLYHRSLLASYLRRSYSVADALTTDSFFTTNVLATVAKLQVTRTIPLWIDYEEFSPARSVAPRIEGHPFRLLFVGNASRRKGADVIPELARRLGGGFEIRCTAGLREAAHPNNPDNVFWLGRLSAQQLVAEYRGCDALLVPSRYEGFGYAALEAMACAKPVVGFRCGAIEEVVADGQTGLLCAIDDIDALEANCRVFASDSIKAVQWGEAGRLRAVTAFTESKAVDAYVDLYRSLVKSANDEG